MSLDAPLSDHREEEMEEKEKISVQGHEGNPDDDENDPALISWKRPRLDTALNISKLLGTSASNPWGSRRLFPLVQGDQTFNMTPVIKNVTIYNLSTSLRGAVLIILLILIGTGIQFVALGSLEKDGNSDATVMVPIWLLGVILNTVALTLTLASYSRSHLWKSVKSFDFVYLSVQVLIFNTIDAIEKAQHLHIGWMVSVLPNSVLTCLVIFGLDASHWTRKMKGGMMVLSGVVYMGLAFTLMFVNKTSHQEVTLILYDTNLGSIAQTCATNLGLFSFKFAFMALIMKKEVIMTRFTASKEEIGEPGSEKAYREECAEVPEEEV